MKVLLFANTDWYLYNFRRSLATSLRDSGYDVWLLSPPGPYAEKLQALGFHWVAAPMRRRSLNPLTEAYLLWWLYRFLKRHSFDLVHGFTIKCAVYGCLSARLAAVPGRVGAVTGMGYVFTSGTFLARVLRPPVRALFKSLLSHPRVRLILQNPDDANLFLSAGLVDPAAVRLIPGSGVDCYAFAPTPQRSLDGRRMRAVLPARLLWDKGVGEFVEASRLLREEGLEVEFLLAGSPDRGNPASISEKQLAEWIEAGLVTHLGHVTDMPALFASVDLVVLPSYREGLPKGLIEAAACGLPLITTDAPGCREVVSHQHNGLLVPVGDARALADAIKMLALSAEMRRSFGIRSREVALEKFDQEIVNAHTISVYQELAQ